MVLSAQVLGCAALFGTILPFVEVPFPAQTQAHSYSRDIRIPFMKVRVGHCRGLAAECLLASAVIQLKEHSLDTHSGSL